MIHFDHVYKSIHQLPILSDLSFQIASGETVVLMGASGCGKSTVLRCINGLEPVDQGRIVVRDVDLSNTPPKFNWNRFRAGIGLVFQNYNLFPHLTVLQNITLAPSR